MAEFHFDFDKVKGLDYDEAFTTLFKQMEDHYNASMQAPKLVFGGKSVKTETPPPAADRQPVNQVPPVAVESAPAGPVDTETVTPKTMDMRSFSIKDGKELGLKEGDVMLKGIGVNDKGNAVEVFDKLLPGYDQMPYGPVVQGESGRYNLKPKGK